MNTIPDPGGGRRSSRWTQDQGDTFHWVSASHAVKAEVRLYDHLFTLRDMDDMEEGTDLHGSPDYTRSLEIITGWRMWWRP